MAIIQDDAGAKLAQAKDEAARFGKFYTPEGVCRLVARLAGAGKRVLDPACGSGAMLYYAREELGAAFYAGQEISAESVALAKRNMPDAAVVCGDTLAEPFDWGEKFDCAVANPPFSVAWTPMPLDPRFAGLAAPKSKADLAFVQHSLFWLRDGGQGAFVLFPGALYRGGSEEKIRRSWIERGWIRAVVQLPDKLFQETQIATVVVVFKKEASDASVLFVDASGMSVQTGKTRAIGAEQVEEIARIVSERKEIKGVAALASRDMILEDCNLSPSRWIEKEIVVDNPYFGKSVAEVVAENKARQKKIVDLMNEIDELIAVNFG